MGVHSVSPSQRPWRSTDECRSFGGSNRCAFRKAFGGTIPLLGLACSKGATLKEAMLIACVDDDPTVLEAVEGVLDASGFRVDVFLSAEECGATHLRRPK